MIDRKELCARLGLDAIYGMDAETYWANDYTLSKMPTSEYIYDERFKLHMMSVQRHDEKKAKVYDPGQFKKFLQTVDWRRNGMLAHHAHFDGLILSKHCNIRPAFYCDTLSMARPIMPVTVGGSLVALCAAFGRTAKKRGAVLLNTKGIRDLDPKQYKQMALYAGDDIGDTWWLFDKLLPYTCDREMHIIDATVRMYACPRVFINAEKVQNLHDSEVKAKAAVLKRLKIKDPKQLRSAASFAALLEAENVEPPRKISKRTDKVAYAFSKTDLGLKKLLGHESPRVRALVRGRLRLSSSQLEKRALRMARRAPWGPQPVYLNYAKALTLRFTGDDKMNWQNFNRGSDLRSAIEAAPGYSFVVVDSAQIEARLNALFSGQLDKVEQFRRKEDVYSITATTVYRRKITKERNPKERFVGKVCDLSLQYQAGWPRFAHSLRAGVSGDPMDIGDDEAQDVHRGWRQLNYMIVSNWKRTMSLVKQAFLSKTRVEDGCVAYEGIGPHGYMHLPNGMSIRYANLEVDPESGNITYLRKRVRKKKGEPVELRTKIYGGLLVENRTQALSRVLLADWIVAIKAVCPNIQLVMTSHDELVYMVKDAQAPGVAKKITKIMSTPPEWMPDLPLAVDCKISKIYEKG